MLKVVLWVAVLASVVAAAAAMLGGGVGDRWRLPDRHNPWAPWSFDEPPGWLTRYKLRQLDQDPAACLAALATTPLRVRPVPDRETGSGCGFSNAVQVRGTSLEVGEPFALSCRAAVSLALWERHVLQPQAEQLLGARVERLQHLGSYACRNVYGSEGGQRSQHARANALDVSGFVLQGGRRISVARDWAGDDAEALFLQAVHRGACEWFDGVLGPDYNRAHADHFHLDRGPYRICR